MYVVCDLRFFLLVDCFVRGCSESSLPFSRFVEILRVWRMGKEAEEGGGEDAPGQGGEGVLADEGDEDHDEVSHQQRTAPPPDATQRPDESEDDERGANESEGGQRGEVLIVGIAGMIGQG